MQLGLHLNHALTRHMSKYGNAMLMMMIIHAGMLAARPVIMRKLCVGV